MKIHHLELDCANLEELKHFYTHKFKFPLVNESVDHFTLKLGESELCFRENRLRKSYYHFAFNISYSAVDQALDWLHQKVDLLRHEGEMLIDFSSWQAKSLYFLDPAGNIVELIGRQNFNADKVANFSESDILNISEVGVPLFEVSSVAKKLTTGVGIPKFDCKGNTFCAVGDDEGLFILVDEAEKTWFPTREPARSYHSCIDFSCGDQRYILETGDDQLSLNKKKEKKKR